MADYISRALVSDALAQWREQLRHVGRASTLRDIDAAEDSTVDLQSAHPSGLAQLFSGRPTLVSSLIRDPAAQALAMRRARAALDVADAARVTTGVGVAALGVGVARWTEDGRSRSMPVVLRPVSLAPARDTDVEVVMYDEVRLNPVLESEVSARAPESTAPSLASKAQAGTAFDPRPVWDELRSHAAAFGDDFAIEEALVLGAFDDPEQRLLADIDECAPLIGSSLLLASVAGDRAAREELTGPLPAVPLGDRDPFAERGLGDLDDLQFSILDVVASGRSLVVQTPPGSDAVGTAVAIAADAAASGKSVAIVAGARRAAQALAEALADQGVDDLVVSTGGDGWNAEARRRLLESMTLASPRFDERALREAGERLLDARADLRERFEDLHRVWSPWGVSGYDCVQAIVRLTSREDPPSTRVRLGATAVRYITDRGIDVVGEAVARAHAARVAAGAAMAPPIVFDEPAATSEGERRWWEGAILDDDRGRLAEQALTLLVTRHLPRAREAARAAALETGVDEAPSLDAWSTQVALFADLRETFDVFSPALFQGVVADLVAATAPEGSPYWVELPKRERKARVRRARELLRPAREDSDVHRELLFALQRLSRWRAQCTEGGWPRVPDGLDAIRERHAEAASTWAAVAAAIATVTGRGDLASAPWDEMAAVLGDVAGFAGEEPQPAHVRDARANLDGADLDAILEDLAARSVPPARAAAEVEFSWWASAFDAIVAANPALVEYGALTRAVSSFLERDAEFARARVRPLMRAVAERRRGEIARAQDAARDVFASLVEGGDAPYARLWERYPRLVGALRPVVVCAADQASQVIPAARILDTVVLMNIESLAFAEVVPALARAAQVVALADVHASTGSAAPQLRESLPVMSLRARPRPVDPRVTAVLADHGYGREMEMLPPPRDAGRLAWVGAEGAGADAAASAAVDALRHGSVAVVASSRDHADAVAEALAGHAGEAAAIPVVTLGAAGAEAPTTVVLAIDGRDAPWGALDAAGIRQALVAAQRDVVVVSPEPPSGAGAGADLLADLVALASGRPLDAADDERRDWLLDDLAERLRAAGVQVRVRYGLGGDVIPLAVGRGADLTDAFVTDDRLPPAGMSLRDQIRWQRSRLESLGWRVHPLWTLDAFVDPAAAARDAIAALDGAPARVAPDPPPAGEPLIPDRTGDESDPREAAQEQLWRDDELRRDVPPHW